MRPIKLTAALAIAAASLALASTAASAAGGHGRAHARHSGGCRVTLNVAPRLLTAGESALAFGRLSCHVAGGEAAQTVTLYESPLGSTAYAVAGTSTTDTQGFYEITASALTANSTFYVVAGTTDSGTKSVKVAAQVTVAGPPEGVVPSDLRTGRHNSVTFTGTVSPVDSGALVVLQRQNSVRGTEWHRIALGTVDEKGAFSITHTFVAPGPANIRVVVRSGKRNIASPSNVLSYEISQAQNPQLTINSSADPISYGQSSTLSGVLGAGANTPVTLLARTAQQTGFTPVQEVKTNASGAYTFTPQTPLASTFYRVEGAGRSSAVLYEGVKYVLTADVSGLTVAAGQALTFSGTVTPNSPIAPGHVIYLDRENAAGTSFHVIETGSVAANSTYTIVHTFYNVGTSVVRIKIPGGPLNATTDSQQFTIQVTPALPSALTPESPGNSTLPGEGQL